MLGAPVVPPACTKIPLAPTLNGDNQLYAWSPAAYPARTKIPLAPILNGDNQLSTGVALLLLTTHRQAQSVKVGKNVLLRRICLKVVQKRCKYATLWLARVALPTRNPQS